MLFWGERFQYDFSVKLSERPDEGINGDSGMKKKTLAHFNDERMLWKKKKKSILFDGYWFFLPFQKRFFRASLETQFYYGCDPMLIPEFPLKKENSCKKKHEAAREVPNNYLQKH